MSKANRPQTGDKFSVMDCFPLPNMNTSAILEWRKSISFKRQCKNQHTQILINQEKQSKATSWKSKQELQQNKYIMDHEETALLLL